MKPKLKVRSPKKISRDKFQVGKAYYFLLAGNTHLVGLVHEYDLSFMCLDSAAFLSGNTSLVRAVVDGQIDLVQPVGQVILNVSAIMQAFPWNHSLPKMPWIKQR